MKAKFKVGDKVKIVEYQLTVPDMKQYVGDCDTITEIYLDNKKDPLNWYKLDQHGYVWREDWLKTIHREEGPNKSELNLCELLKGHEGETFYSDVFGIVTLIEVSSNFITIHSCPYDINLYSNGSKIEGERCVIFPSEDSRDWNKWAEEQKPKSPKTWKGIVSLHLNKEYEACTTSGHRDVHLSTSIEKSALALFKIHQLIGIGYGGNITNEEWNEYTNKYVLKWEHGIIKRKCIYEKEPIAFHTAEQRDEFLSYPENEQLVEDFYMI